MAANALLGDSGSSWRLRPQYLAYGVEGEGLFLLGEHGAHILAGQIFVDLLPYLRTGHAESLIADLLEPLYPRTTVHYAYALLNQRNLLTDAPDDVQASAASFWDALDCSPRVATTRLQTAKVGVSAVGSVDADAVIDALTAMHMPAALVPVPTDESVHLVITDDYLHPEVATLAERNWQDRRPMLLARASGTELWIGPVIHEQGACYACLAWRLSSNMAVTQYVRRKFPDEQGHSRAIGQTPVHSGLVANLMALEAAKWLAGAGELSPGITTISLRNLTTANHVIRPRPQCAVCGNPGLQTELMTRRIDCHEEDPSRMQTLQDFSSFVDPLTGIVTSVDRAQTGDQSLHSYTAYFGFAKDAPDLAALKNGLLSQAAGVGATPEQAQIGAICEALERYSGMYQGDEPALRTAYRELDPASVIHPADCMLYSAAQYARRDQINSEGAPFNLVPFPFDSAAPMDWTGVWSLTHQRFKLLPATFLFYNYPQPPGGPYCWADSNGCAAGKSLPDAIRRGLLELIERDSVALWWYNRIPRPAVDLASFQDAYIDQWLRTYAQLGREAWVIDITTDSSVPCFAAISRRSKGATEDILLAFGADPDARAAIAHAIWEMNHLLPAVLPENRNLAGDYPYPDDAQKAWWRTATVASESYLLADSDAQPRGVDHYPMEPPASSRQQLASMVEKVHAMGREILVLNQTRPDVGVSVAKVIVPGLRHFWARFAPGRLYDMPTTMGWLETPRTEAQLNPIAMFL